MAICDEILMGRYGPRNTVWITSAMSLPYADRISAFSDIADMLGMRFVHVSIAAERARERREAIAAAGHFRIAIGVKRATRADAISPVSHVEWQQRLLDQAAGQAGSPIL